MTKICRDYRYVPPLPAQLNLGEHGLKMGPKLLYIVEEDSTTEPNHQPLTDKFDYNGNNGL